MHGVSLSPCSLLHAWQRSVPLELRAVTRVTVPPASCASCASCFHTRWPCCMAAMLRSSCVGLAWLEAAARFLQSLLCETPFTFFLLHPFVAPTETSTPEHLGLIYLHCYFCLLIQQKLTGLCFLTRKWQSNLLMFCDSELEVVKQFLIPKYCDSSGFL